MKPLSAPPTLLALAIFGLSFPNHRMQGAESLQITNVQRAAPGMALHWTGTGTNVAYTVQSRDGLGEGLWLLPPATNPWPTAETSWVEAAAATSAARFYRVMAVPAAQRGRVLSSQLSSTLTTFQIALLLNAAGIPLTPQYNVQLHKVVYETIDPLGARTVASAAMALPADAGKALPLFSYQHGTLTRTNEAPSSMNIYGEVGIGIAFATTGYASVLPDYLGMGDSPGLHPYHHARSEATACVDALRALRALCSSNSIPPNGQLFLMGYSQGGHATMALHRELETYHANEFTITASAPMAGAYDLSGVTTDDMLFGRPQPNPYYFAYLLAAYQEVYRLAPTFGELLQAPYNTTLPPLFNGNSSGSQINAAMPADPLDILKPELLADFRTNANHILRQALRDNDLSAWTPQRPMRLYHCAGDLDVIIANSQVAYASFQGRGATQVELLDPQPSADHGGCTTPSMLSAKAWFDSLKQ
jgi:pimeloyl-ACP methyl ester carboxylesterase